MSRLFVVLAIVFAAANASAQTTKHTVYIEPTDDGFEVYLAAALHKKGVPVSIVSNPSDAAFSLKAAQIEINRESTGSKVVRCLFAYCAGIEDKASTSATLTSREGIVEWSYAVNKGRGSKNRQSMAEAIAKHLKDEYFQKWRPIVPVHTAVATAPTSAVTRSAALSTTTHVSAPATNSETGPAIEGLSATQVVTMLGKPAYDLEGRDGVTTWFYEIGGTVVKVFFFEEKASLKRQR